MSGMKKIQRKKLQEEEKIFAEEIQIMIELAKDDDRRKHNELETENADEMVWLMKCLPRVDKAWRDLSTSTSSFSPDLVLLAKYMDSVDLLLPDFSPELTMEMVSAELWNISKLYSVNKLKDFFPASIFSKADQGKVAVEGMVTHKLDLTVNCGNEQYGIFFRERSRKQVLDNCRGEHLMPNPDMVTKELKQCVSRTRSDRNEMEAKMVQLFERQQKWTLKQLVQETNQPEVCSLLKTCI